MKENSSNSQRAADPYISPISLCISRMSPDISPTSPLQLPYISPTSPSPRACGRSRRARRGGARGGNPPTAAARPALLHSCSRRAAPVRGGGRGRIRDRDRDRFRARVRGRGRGRVRGEVHIGRVLAEPPHLPYISPYLPYISAISPLHLP